MIWKELGFAGRLSSVRSVVSRTRLRSGSWKGMTRGSEIRASGRFKRCFTCCNMLPARRFAIDKKVKDGRAEMCFECVKFITGREKNRQKRKTRTRYEQYRHEFYCLTRHVWLFPGGWTFPRAEMFRKGLSLWRVFEEACISKVKTERKI